MKPSEVLALASLVGTYTKQMKRLESLQTLASNPDVSSYEITATARVPEPVAQQQVDNGAWVQFDIPRRRPGQLQNPKIKIMDLDASDLTDALIPLAVRKLRSLVEELRERGVVFEEEEVTPIVG